MKFFIKLTLVALLFSSCTEEPHHNKIIIGTSADNPPYEFIEAGEYKGFDIDFAHKLSEELGKEVEFKNIEFHGLMLSLLSGQIDIVIAGVTPSEERAKKVDFSDYYAENQMAALFSDKDSINSESDIKSKKIGAQFGTVWNEKALAILGQAANEVGNQTEGNGALRSLPDNLTLISELESGAIDVVILDRIQALKFSTKNPRLKFITLQDTESKYAVAIAKNSPLTPEINKIISQLKASGFFDRLTEKWLK